MKHMSHDLVRIASATALALALTTSGCGRKSEPTMESTLVPGADFVARMDMAALRSSPVILAMKDKDRDANSLWKPFWDATGLTQDDVTTVLISMDLDKMDLSQSSPSPDMNGIDAVMALELQKPLTLAQLKTGIAAMDKTGMASPTDVVVEGEPGLQSDEGGVVCLVDQGRKVFVAPNVGSMTEGLKRFKKGRTAPLSDEMTAAFDGLTEQPQVRAVLVLTDALQAKLKADIEKQKLSSSGGLGASMFVNMLGPIADVESLGFSMTCTSDFALSLGCIFNTPDAALQMKTTADLALGMMMMSLQQKAPETSKSLAECLKIEQAEKRLNINLALTESDLNTLQSFQKPTGVTP